MNDKTDHVRFGLDPGLAPYDHGRSQRQLGAGWQQGRLWLWLLLRLLRLLLLGMHKLVVAVWGHGDKVVLVRIHRLRFW